MSSLQFAAGGYRYIPGVFQYSAGVAALDGFRIERVIFAGRCRSGRASTGSRPILPPSGVRSPRSAPVSSARPSR